jgi:RNA polymerase sigma-70 factor (ECF subfamily)
VAAPRRIAGNNAPHREVSGPPLPAPGDEELMRRYQLGDERAFQTLFGRHAGRVYRYLLYRTGSAPLAEDLTQQAFLQLHQARHRFRSGARLAPWLHTIVANLLRDCQRARGRSREELTADGTLPERAAERDEGSDQAAQVRRLLQELPEEYREVILLHRYLELELSEIAEVLGTTEGAVKQRAYRAYQMIRERLGRGEAP